MINILKWSSFIVRFAFLLLPVILFNQCQLDRSNEIDLEYTPGTVELFAEKPYLDKSL